MANILVIDDQTYVRELFSEALMDEDHRVVSFGDAESVTGYLNDSEPDLVLLDLYLDGFEGWDVLRYIKRMYPHLPVVIVTAYDSYVDDPRLLQAEGYVVKSLVALDILKQKIAEVLEQKAA